MRVLGRAAVLVALAAALSFVAAPASAHAYLDHSNPGDGTSLASAPDSLRLAFSEHVVLSATTLELIDDDAHAVPVRHLRLVSDDPEDTEAPAQLVADLPELSRGAYRLTWSTLSSDDLHRTSGVVVFGIRTTVAGGGVHESSPDPLEAASGTAVLAGAALLLGAPLALHTLRRAPAPARRRVRRVAVTGGVVALVVGFLTVVRVAWTDELAALTAGGYAVRWLVRTVGLVLLVHGVRSGRRVSLLLGALLTATGEALLGHAVAQVAGDPLRVPVTAVHLLAALGWTGAVVGIAVGLGLRPDRMLPVPELRADLRRFALPAATGLTVAVITGAWLASDVVVSVDAALLTSYGRTLLLKVGLVGAVCALALLNHRRLRGRRDLEVPRRTIGAEAVAIGGLLAATALLVAGQPATEPQLVDAGPAANHGPVARQVADLEETVGLKPNRAGSSVVLVDVFDRRRPAPGPISDVAVRIGDRALGSARPLGNGHWSVPVSDLAGGRTAVTVTVSRADAEPVTATYPWVVGASTPHPDVVVSRAPATSALRLLAGASGVVAACAAVVARRRRPRPRAVVPAAEPEKETVS